MRACAAASCPSFTSSATLYLFDGGVIFVCASDDVVNAVQRGNVDLPVGTLDAPNRAYTLVSDAQLTNAAGYQSLVVTYRNGAPVRIQDLGRAIDSVENKRVASWYNGKRAVILGVQRQPGANVVEVVDAVKALVPTLQAQIPQSVKLDIFFDRTQAIRESVHDVQLTLIGTIVLGLGTTVLGNLTDHPHDYRETVSPWFRSIFYLQPQPELMAAAPLGFQLHALSAWILFAFWPFSRLVHAWSVPVGYLSRSHILYRSRRPGAVESDGRPRATA